MTEIYLFSHNDRWCHTVGIFPSRGTYYAWRAVSLAREDAQGMTLLAFEWLSVD